MASANKIILLGRLTRDVETRSFSTGGKVAKWGFAVDGERKKDQTTGKWKAEPVFLDCEVFNRGENGKQADTAEQYLSKGKLVYIEGHLKQENWTGQDGQKRNKLIVVVDSFQMLDSNKQTEGNGNWSSQSRNSNAEKPVNPTYAPDGNPDDVPFGWLIGFIVSSITLMGIC